MAYYAPFYQPTNFYNSQIPLYQPQSAVNSVPQNSPIQPQQTSDFIWVLNENEATSYPVAPNASVILWDKSKATIYIKSANAQGVPSMRILDFTERTTSAATTPEKHICTCGNNFVPKKDFEALRADFDELAEAVNSLKAKASTKTKKSEVENDG